MFLAVRSLARAPQRTFQTRHCSTGVSGVNKVILVGTVEGAPRVYTFDNGTAAAFTVTTYDSYTDKHTGSLFLKQKLTFSGEEKKFTEWHRVLVRNNQSLVDMCEKLNKG